MPPVTSSLSGTDERDRLRLIEQHPRRHARREIRVQLRDAREDRFQITSGVGDRYAFPEPRHAVVVEPTGERIVRVELNRHPELRLGRRESERVRHHAHDLATLPIHLERSPDDCAVRTES